jgi:uncharacterized cupin superfamily protein
MVPEAPVEQVDHGLAPKGDGWFVVNARETRWFDGVFGAYNQFQGDVRFAQIGVAIGVLQPGQPACRYHGEADQEGFLVLQGECRLLVEGQERPLKQWDFFHCPPWTEHVFVGAGEGPCTILAFGGRAGEDIVYPVNELAARHGASVPETTNTPEVAYANLPPDQPVPFQEGWLPG